MSEGPGSLLMYGGSSLDQALFIDRQLDTGDPALSSSSSILPLILGISGSLRGKPVTLTVRLQDIARFKEKVC